MSMINEEDNTPAAASLHPMAMPADGMNDFDPTKSEMLAYALQVMGGMSKDDLNHFLASMEMSTHSADSIPDGAAQQNMASIMAKPSGSAAMVSEEDISTLFEGHDVSEEFVIKAKSIMESAIDARLTLEAAHLQEQYETLVEQAYEEITEEMSDKVDQYMNYVVSEWMEENRLVLDRGVKNDVMESFVEGLKNLFAEHYIDVPEEQVDALQTLSDRVEELEARLNDQMSYNMSLQNEIANAQKNHVIDAATHDLSDDDAERLTSLAENLEFKGLESFERSVSVLKESLQTKNTYSNYRPVRNTGLITEDVFLTEDEYNSTKAISSANPVVAYAQHISRTAKKV